VLWTLALSFGALACSQIASILRLKRLEEEHNALFRKQCLADRDSREMRAELQRRRGGRPKKQVQPIAAPEVRPCLHALIDDLDV
jgi:hypothetical protein